MRNEQAPETTAAQSGGAENGARAATGEPVARRVTADTLRRMTKANKRFERLLNEKLGTDFFGTVNLEVIFAEGQVAQVNVYGVEKIR